MKYPIIDEGFGFGFNNEAFSDRVLRLEIIPALPSDMDSGGSGLKVKNLHINSLLLAAESQFFRKLFENGMRESQNKDDVTLRINASEEAALMDLLSFMYWTPMIATTTSDLVDVLMAADKFEVISCMRYCIDQLLTLPMSIEIAFLNLELPSSVLVVEDIRPLIDAAMMYLVSYFRDFTKSQQKTAMTLPLCALEVVLSSDGLKVDSEDDVFEFILKWARLHYPKMEERRDILAKLLSELICFAYMSSSKLKEVVVCTDLDYEQVSKLVLNVLISKDEVLPTTKCGLPKRVYKYRLIKVVQLEFVQPRCVVYLDLKKEECGDLYPSRALYSQPFCVCGRDLYLMAKCQKKQPNSPRKFYLFVGMKGSESCELDYEFAVMKKPSKEFQIGFTKRKSTFTEAASKWG